MTKNPIQETANEIEIESNFPPFPWDCETLARYLKVPKGRVWKYTREGKIPHRRISHKCIRFTAGDVAAIFDRAAR